MRTRLARRQRAREHLSGLAPINTPPNNLTILELLLKAAEQNRSMRQTFIEIFTGATPV